MYKVLVLTLETGEPQLESQIQLLSKQKSVTIKQIIISDKPTLLAEQEIFNLSHQNRDVFDWVIKLDADMEPSNDYSLINLIKRAKITNDCHRLTTPVFDYYTRDQIMGVHIFDPKHIPLNHHCEEFKPDSWITKIKGNTLLYVNNPQILHGRNPNIKQTLRFGLHRGLKAYDGGSNSVHWLTYSKIFDNYKVNNDELSRIILLSFIFSFKGISDGKLTWKVVNSNSYDNEFAIKEITKISEIYNRKFILNEFKTLTFHFNNYKSLKDSFKLILRINYYRLKSFIFKKTKFI